MNPVSKSGKPREETPPCTTLFPNPESREEEKKSHSWQNPTDPPQLEEPHLHEPVSKSGKPREEKKMTQKRNIGSKEMGHMFQGYGLKVSEALKDPEP